MNINIDFKNFVEILKLPPSIAAFFSLSSGSILFLPESIIKKFYLYDLKDKFGIWVSLVFITSTALLLIFIIGYFVEKIVDSIKMNQLKEMRTKLLKDFDHDKVVVIRLAITAKDNTVCLPMDNGTTKILQFYNVISPASSTNIIRGEFKINYFLQPWVVNTINSNQELQDKYIGFPG